MSESQTNPYGTPTASLDVGVRLASRGARLGAWILDVLLISLINGPITYSLGWMPLDGTMPALSAQISAAIMTIIIGLLLNGYFLATRGQSLGKMALGIRIVDAESGQLLPIVKLVLLRIVPFTAVQLVHAVLGPLIAIIDILFIFGDSRRCLHDRLAGTVVVEASVVEASVVEANVVGANIAPAGVDPESVAQTGAATTQPAEDHGEKLD